MKILFILKSNFAFFSTKKNIINILFSFLIIFPFSLFIMTSQKLYTFSTVIVFTAFLFIDEIKNHQQSFDLGKLIIFPFKLNYKINIYLLYEFFSLKFILVFIYLLVIIIYSPSHSLYIFLILITFILILSFINFIIKRSYLANKIYKYGKAPFSYLLLIPFLNVITGSSNSKIYLPILQQFENDISSNIFFQTVTSFQIGRASCRERVYPRV